MCCHHVGTKYLRPRNISTTQPACQYPPIDPAGPKEGHGLEVVVWGFDTLEVTRCSVFYPVKAIPSQDRVRDFFLQFFRASACAGSSVPVSKDIVWCLFLVTTCLDTLLLYNDRWRWWWLFPCKDFRRMFNHPSSTCIFKKKWRSACTH